MRHFRTLVAHPGFHLAQRFVTTCSPVVVVHPRVWIGCLACYNAGRLAGEWFDAGVADGVTPEGLRNRSTSHEELWVFDLGDSPRGAGEMSPSAAALWGELCEEMGEIQWDALLAWVETGCHVTDPGDFPCVSDFEERFCGCWNSGREYFAHLADEMGLWDEVPEHLHSYFDLDAWWRDEHLDYAVADAPGGGVLIFHSR